MMRIGVDVGGTNTDAVLLGPQGVLGKKKTPTTLDVTTGIVTALRDLLHEVDLRGEAVRAVMIGTTHFTNAVVQHRDLSPVAAIRLALPATECLPPMVDWPEDFREALHSPSYLLHGGSEYDGRAIAPLRDEELAAVADDLLRRDLRSAAITGVFASVNPSMEVDAGRYLMDRIPGLDVTYSHQIGRLGLLERENATILNASLRGLARSTVSAFREAVGKLGMRAPLYLTQNDGTLMAAEFAERFPILTFSSGATNSIRGAAYLSGMKHGVVVDIGGTTTDVGVIVDGFPRQASIEVEVGGVRTNFRMPDVHSVALGGGSVVRFEGPDVRIGPDSVGHELTTKALVFGGTVLTATDVAALSGHAAVGDPGRVAGVPQEMVRAADLAIAGTIDRLVDRARLSSEPVPVILVGGGRVLVGGEIGGAERLVVPDHHEVANAVGAAIAQVSGEVERVVDVDTTSRESAIEQARLEARQRAVAAGAAPDSVRVLDVEDVPLAYLPGNASRLRVKVVGDLPSGT